MASSSAAEALARYYDLDLADDPGDIDMYVALAHATDGSILELMAGSGRVAVPLAMAGHKVVAVDRDSHMLGRAAAYWQRVKRRAAKGGALELIEAEVSHAQAQGTVRPGHRGPEQHAVARPR